MSYSGKFRPSNRHKYKGDPTNIIYRSLWERKFMVWCDKNVNVLEWGSEEIVIPYISPVDGGFIAISPISTSEHSQERRDYELIIEVKPKIQCAPPKRPKRQTKKYITEVKTFGVNQAKWKAAREYCKDRNMEFLILTEKELNV